LASGVIYSGNASGSILSGMLANASVVSGSIASGQVSHWHIGNAEVQSGNIASGNVSLFHLASGVILSGNASGSISSGMLANNSVVSGSIASGQVGQFQLASPAVFSGNIASGNVSLFHLASGVIASGLVSGEVTSGFLGNNSVVSGSVASGQLFNLHIANGGLASGNYASGSIGQFHIASPGIASGNIASGVIVWTHLTSGVARSGHLADNSVNSGNISSGSVGPMQIASGAIGSGRLNTIGTPNGTLFLRDDFNWASVGGGSITSGEIVSGNIGNAAVVSGSIASGQISKYHFASGATIDSAEWLIDDTFLTVEPISGVKACQFFSGGLRTAMSAVSGRMPAIGITSGSVASGVACTVYRNGRFFGTTNNYSGWQGQTLYVGASGDVISSGAPTASGNIQQSLGAVINASGVMIQIGESLQCGGLVYSGDIASGQIGAVHIPATTLNSGTNVTAATFLMNNVMVTTEMISGIRGVNVSQSGLLQVAMAGVSGRFPAVGVCLDNVQSGQSATFYAAGYFQAAAAGSGQVVDYSGYIGKPIWLGRSGQITCCSGSYMSGGGIGMVASQRLGVTMNSGGAFFNCGGMLGVSGLVTSINAAVPQSMLAF